jgi:hypothetical protein
MRVFFLEKLAQKIKKYRLGVYFKRFYNKCCWYNPQHLFLKKENNSKQPPYNKSAKTLSPEYWKCSQ